MRVPRLLLNGDAEACPRAKVPAPKSSARPADIALMFFIWNSFQFLRRPKGHASTLGSPTCDKSDSSWPPRLRVSRSCAQFVLYCERLPSYKTLQTNLTGGSHMALQLGDVVPDFEADTTEGRIRFHNYIDGSWAVFFSHPKDFTPVCTTELGSMARMKHEFDKRGVKLIGISVDSVDDHQRWKKDIQETTGGAVNYPMIGD